MKPTPVSVPKDKEKKKRIYLGWMHSETIGEGRKFVKVNALKGGGTREISLTGSSTKEDTIEVAKSKFFPEGSSKYFGSLDDMEFDLLNSQGEIISTLVDAQGNTYPFTLQNYSDITNYSRLRFYFGTSNKNPRKSELLNSAASTSGLQTKRTRKSIYSSTSVQGKKKCLSSLAKKGKQWRTSLFEEKKEEKPTNETQVSEKSNLIGTSSDRKDMIDQQNIEYECSLQADREKDQVKAKELKDKTDKEERIKRLQIFRAKRIPPEPTESSERVRVAVQHPALGRQWRYFSKTDTLIAVYDWVGSLSLYPEYFTLCSSPHQPCLPSTPIDEIAGQILYVKEECNGMMMWPDDPEINFLGYGVLGSISNNDTVMEENTNTADDFDFYELLNSIQTCSGNRLVCSLRFAVHTLYITALITALTFYMHRTPCFIFYFFVVFFNTIPCMYSFLWSPVYMYSKPFLMY